MYPHHRFIQSYCHQGRIGVLIEFGLETWLVTQREDFLAMSKDLAMHVAASNPDSVDALLLQPFVRDTNLTVAAALANASATLGEKVIITRFVRWDQEPPRAADKPTPPRHPAVAVRAPSGYEV
jgi:elongation factor Ts